MKYYSEHTKKFYDTAAECEKAEQAEKEKQLKIEAEQKAKAEAREQRAKEVEDAMEEACKAREKFDELLEKFVEDYGSFHYSYRNKGENDEYPVSTLFSLLKMF